MWDQKSYRLPIGKIHFHNFFVICFICNNWLLLCQWNLSSWSPTWPRHFLPSFSVWQDRHALRRVLAPVARPIYPHIQYYSGSNGHWGHCVPGNTRSYRNGFMSVLHHSSITEVYRAFLRFHGLFLSWYAVNRSWDPHRCKPFLNCPVNSVGPQVDSNQVVDTYLFIHLKLNLQHNECAKSDGVCWTFWKVWNSPPLCSVFGLYQLLRGNIWSLAAECSTMLPSYLVMAFVSHLVWSRWGFIVQPKRWA